MNPTTQPATPSPFRGALVVLLSVRAVPSHKRSNQIESNRLLKTAFFFSKLRQSHGTIIFAHRGSARNGTYRDQAVFCR